ncbi:hypothetical protein BK147_08585 [Paenibacillus sp. FSL R7-0337]|nr:hypothetical protein BK147_08585 [Paenibacillus sp. FSL R7-0337]
MQKFITHILRALFHTLIIVLIHLLIVYLLNLRIEGWNHEILGQIIRAYALPVSLMLFNHTIYFKDNILKYKKIWFFVNLFPTLLLLIIFKVTVDNSSSDFLSGYQFQLIALLPKIFIFIQFILFLFGKLSVGMIKIDTK